MVRKPPFTFKASAAGKALIKAVELLCDLNRRNRRQVPDDAPMPFRGRRWRQLVREGGTIDRRLYETAVLATLRDGLRAGDVWVDGTRNYRRFDAYLLPKQQAAAAAADLSIDTDASRYLQGRAEELDLRLTRFARLLRTDRLEGVSLQRGKLRIRGHLKVCSTDHVFPDKPRTPRLADLIVEPPVAPVTAS